MAGRRNSWLDRKNNLPIWKQTPGIILGLYWHPTSSSQIFGRVMPSQNIYPRAQSLPIQSNFSSARFREVLDNPSHGQ
jgi:hypothetical protein